MTNAEIVKLYPYREQLSEHLQQLEEQLKSLRARRDKTQDQVEVLALVTEIYRDTAIAVMPRVDLKSAIVTQCGNDRTRSAELWLSSSDEQNEQTWRVRARVLIPTIYSFESWQELLIVDFETREAALAVAKDYMATGELPGGTVG